MNATSRALVLLLLSACGREASDASGAGGPATTGADDSGSHPPNTTSGHVDGSAAVSTPSGDAAGLLGENDGAPTPADAVTTDQADGAAGSGSDGGEASVPGAPTIGGDGYVTLSSGGYTLSGGVSDNSGGSGTSIALTYGSSSFCASGTVGINTSYQAWAAAGFNVNQSRSNDGGGAGSLPFAPQSVTLSFSNAAKSPLQIELSDDHFIFWCYTLTQLTSPVTIPLASFNTACWDQSGTSFPPGTAIQSLQLVVPGSATSSTPFDFCFLGMTIE